MLTDTSSDISQLVLACTPSFLHFCYFTINSAVTQPFHNFSSLYHHHYHQHCLIQEFSEWRLSHCGSSVNLRLRLSPESLFT
ncbi:hypothetical protein GQ44DRAFT_703545 [Phaeosphaeriaceae sp. PMI808]|nr:hypothetical protein GQ44DRAFT_703545 [Phaeosphaeriaceae sp. PMI808]